MVWCYISFGVAPTAVNNSSSGSVFIMNRFHHYQGVLAVAQSSDNLTKQGKIALRAGRAKARLCLRR